MIRLKEVLRREGGFTIIEMMVVMLLLSILVGVFYTFLFGAERAANDGRSWLELNENARLTIERVSRELREADTLISVGCFENGNPCASGDPSINFQSDFDSSGTYSVTGTFQPDITPGEVVRYQYSSATRQLLVSTNETVTPTALADNISTFRMGFFGSDPKYDTGCVPLAVSGCAAGDGIITWQEIDQAAIGNKNGRPDGEYDFITSIVLDMTVSLRSQNHTYRTGIELRNAFR